MSLFRILPIQDKITYATESTENNFFDKYISHEYYMYIKRLWLTILHAMCVHTYIFIINRHVYEKKRLNSHADANMQHV